jgi:antitoxin component YwqK of YwqJK toxin-antitoxin module
MHYIICFILVIGSLHCSAQKIEDYSLKHSMKQNGLAMTFTVLDSDEKGIKHYDTHKTYYWYKSQTVLGTQGGSAGQLLHGAYEAFYDNKQLCEKGSYAKGLKIGEWNYWQKNGKLIRTEHWKNGRLSGEQIYYSKAGDVQKRTIIRGNKTTEQSGDTLIEISKSSKTVTLMDSIGRVKSVARYKNSLLHGKQETFASDGSKSVETYKKGEVVVPKGKKGKSSDGEDATTPNAEKEGFFKRLKSRFSKKDKTDEKASDDKKLKKDASTKLSKKNKKEAKPEKQDGQPVAPEADKTEEKPKKSFKLFKRKSE